jgi:hypothetical protein
MACPAAQVGVAVAGVLFVQTIHAAFYMLRWAVRFDVCHSTHALKGRYICTNRTRYMPPTQQSACDT